MGGKKRKEGKKKGEWIKYIAQLTTIKYKNTGDRHEGGEGNNGRRL